MYYAEYPPPDALRDMLHCLWTFEDTGGAGEPQRIVPDGRCELVVHLGDPYREVDAQVRAAVELIERTGGGVEVADLAAASGLGRRTLERRTEIATLLTQVKDRPQFAPACALDKRGQQLLPR